MTSPARETLVDELTRWTNSRDEWVSQSAAWRSEAEQLRSGMAEAVLQVGSSAAGLSSRLRELDDQVATADQAVEAALPKVLEAKAALLEFDARVLDVEADRLEDVLDQHRAKTDKLLKQLERHEGTFAPKEGTLVMNGGAIAVPVRLRSDDLMADVNRARVRASVLRDLAAGHNPMATAYRGDPGPDGRLCQLVGSDGLVFGLPPAEYMPPATWPREMTPELAHEIQVEELRARLGQLDEGSAALGTKIEEKQDRLAVLEKEIDTHSPTRPGVEDLALQDLHSRRLSLRAWIRELKAEHRTGLVERAAVVAELDALSALTAVSA